MQLKAYTGLKLAKPDKLYGRILRLCKNQLSNILGKLFQQSLSTASLPRIWKTSEIVPVLNKTNRTSYNDYRPVAVTSVIMKSFEYIVKKVLIE